MTMEQMRTFLAVADCLNFTKAADDYICLSLPSADKFSLWKKNVRHHFWFGHEKEVRLTPAGAIMSAI